MMINIKNIVLRFLSGNFVSKVLPGAGNFAERSAAGL